MLLFRRIRVLATVAVIWGIAAVVQAKSPAYVEATFGEECRRILLKELANAKDEVRVAIYMFTDRKILAALQRVHKRDVDLIVKYDQGTAQRFELMQEMISTLRGSGVDVIPVVFEKSRGKMHNKFVVIDRKKVLTGSYNFTVTAAEASYENFVRIESAVIAKRYLDEFENIEDH
jgi:phosphatidylserine/phosphatidylglycerophosphate/cardiolipin synthase-like enzyme